MGTLEEEVEIREAEEEEDNGGEGEENRGAEGPLRQNNQVLICFLLNSNHKT